MSMMVLWCEYIVHVEYGLTYSCLWSQPPRGQNLVRGHQNMFASLLAASRASNFRLIGCTRTDADICAGRIPPSGSTSLAPREVPSVVPGRWMGSKDANGPPSSGSVLEGRGTVVEDPEL